MPGLAHFFQHMPFLVSVFLVYIIMELNTSVMDRIVSHIKRIRVRHGVSPFKLHVLVLSWIGFPPSSTPLFLRRAVSNHTRALIRTWSIKVMKENYTSEESIIQARRNCSVFGYGDMSSLTEAERE